MTGRNELAHALVDDDLVHALVDDTINSARPSIQRDGAMLDIFGDASAMHGVTSSVSSYWQ